ncbi:MAG: hypothetical protein GXO48_07040, partial [Chlorobi bacterium]|nr:hypothetical protein [Chlorobiota bacterium]
MEKGSIAIKVRKLLIENGFDREQADVLALVFDDIYHSYMSDVATKKDVVLVREEVKSLREDMKMFMQMMDKRFEETLDSIKERFEVTDRRFEEALDNFDK